MTNMNKLKNIVVAIRDCCTRREEVQVSKYKQLLDLLPIHDKNDSSHWDLFNSTASETLSFLEQHTKRNHRNNKNIKNRENEMIPKEEQYLSSEEDDSSVPASINKEESKKIHPSMEQNILNNNINNNNNNYNNKKKVILCAHGTWFNPYCIEKHFKLKQTQIISRYNVEGLFEDHFVLVSISGNQMMINLKEEINNAGTEKLISIDKNQMDKQTADSKQYRSPSESSSTQSCITHKRNPPVHTTKEQTVNTKNIHHTNAECCESKKKERIIWKEANIFFNNYDQFFFIQAYDFKIIGLLSGIGKNSTSVCDHVTFYLLKSILTTLKQVYKSDKGPWTPGKMEYILLLSINQVNDFMKANLQESFNSGCALCVCAYSYSHQILTVLNIGNVQAIIAKNVEEDGEEEEEPISENSKNIYEPVVITRTHDLLNEEEKERILSFGSSIHAHPDHQLGYSWNHCEYTHKFQNEQDLHTINVTKALGLFNFNKYGLLNTPDIVDVKLSKSTKGYLILFNNSIRQIYSSSNLVNFLFNNTHENLSLTEISKKLIHNAQSVYMSTDNNIINDMSICILPLID